MRISDWSSYVCSSDLAYNAGPGRYEQHLETGRPLPRETRAYLAILAPMVGGSQPRRATNASADPLAWNSAPLFAMRADDARAAPPPEAAPPPAAATSAPAVAPEVHTDRLLVPPSGPEPSCRGPHGQAACRGKGGT